MEVGEEGELAVEGLLNLGSVGGENARGDRTGEVRDRGHAAMFEEQVAELAAVAKDREPFDLLQRVSANSSGDTSRESDTYIY